jgi:hypothetical protein
MTLCVAEHGCTGPASFYHVHHVLDFVAALLRFSPSFFLWDGQLSG